MTALLTMKERPRGFLNPDNVPSELFDYCRELHEVLWRFVRAEYPDASGHLDQWLPVALAHAEGRCAKLSG